jgi:magnesium-protoporphyrin IX monomethyl ester (oxidative) cyclase
MKEKYKCSEVSFDDDNLTLSRKRMVALCEMMINEKLDLSWDTPNGVSVITLNRELLELMKKAGCRSLNLAIESADPHVLLDIIHKPLNLEKAEQVIRDCKKLGIKTEGYFVLGMPGETLESMQCSLDFARRSELDEVGVFAAVPFPKTELHELASQKGYMKNIDFCRVEADNALQESMLLDTPWLKSEDVLAFRQQFYDAFVRSSIRKRISLVRHEVGRRVRRSHAPEM